MRPVSKDEIRKLDEWAIKELGIPRIILMENAGRGVAHALSLEVPNLKSVCIIVGKGNNGGDGIVSARHLFTGGVYAQIFLLAKKSDLDGEPRTNLDIAEKMGIPVVELLDEASLQKLGAALSSCDAVVDAIFGVGFQGGAEGIFAKAIDLINSTKRDLVSSKPYYVVSVDIPSGMDADTGSIGGHCVEADLTITFTFPKNGMFTTPAIDYVGKLTIIDIGIPREAPLHRRQESPKKGMLDFDIITGDLVASKMPSRKMSANKGDNGEVLLIASSLGMTGAAVMAAKSALRVGAGLVRIGVPESLASFVNSQCAEAITIPLPETAQKTLSRKGLDRILSFYERANVLAIGPGLSTSPETVQLIQELIRAIGESGKKIPVVIDADGLNAVAFDTSILRAAGTSMVLTPHPGEMSRLTGISVDDIQARRPQTAKDAAKKFGAVVVLKGARTVISNPDGEIFVNLTGNPAMASAGMGDVLTGAISGLIAQGISAWDAAISGVYIHGMAGDVVSSLKGDRGILATDLIDVLPYVIRSIIR